MPKRRPVDWKERFTFLDAAERDFDGPPADVRQAFVDAFPEFSRHPWRATLSLDVGPLREMPGRWRLKVAGGHRGIYRALQGIPEFEMFETRDEVYARLRKFLSSKE